MPGNTLSGNTHQHETATGAAASQIHHALGGHGDPTITDDRTVSAQETEQTPRIDNIGVGTGPQVLSTSGNLEVLCGPLLNYRRMSGEHTDNPIWHGSVLVVTTPGQKDPQMEIRLKGSNQQEGLGGTITGEKLYEDTKSGFWRFMIEIPFQARESTWQYTILNVADRSPSENKPSRPQTFAIPAKTQSMRIMFHSCNGFSVGTDTEAWNGCALWNDVLRCHAEKPFHVMIGGGDQIYNDGVRVDGPLKPWTDIGNPHKRREFPFNEDLRAQCDQYYFDNYIRWYGTEPFSTANGQIPQLNIWDDHDIIDGFGSYTDHFMRSAVFRGIGGVAHKYYLLFQHHLPPPVSTFTTDAPKTMQANDRGTSGRDAHQLRDTWVNTAIKNEPCYIIGKSPGPYVEERSRSIYCQLGAKMAFLGIDARTERTRHQINYPETYQLIFDRVLREIAASNGALKHLVLLLGVPIAYPRLQWLENILQSPIIGPIRFLNKRFGFAGGFFNHFDGGVDLLDDLDDHYTSHQHKKERKMLIQKLQTLSHEHSIRVTILGGDVHLAALGRFYSNPKLNIPTVNDWRYMANVVSSAITNKPPPQAVANLLARRNKIHHLDDETDETLLNMFDQDPGAGQPGVEPKTASKNHCTMPSRNFAIICESHDAASSLSGAATNGINGHANGLTNGMTNGVNGHDHATTNGVNSSMNGSHTNGTNGTLTNGANGNKSDSANDVFTDSVIAAHENFTREKNPRNPQHVGEKDCGSTHPAASGLRATGLGGPHGLDITIRVEINPHDREGRTDGYGFSIPGLDVSGRHEKQRVT